MPPMRVEEFDYQLPPELIAQSPTVERGASRLLCLDGRTGSIADHTFRDLPSFLHESDLLVFNDTRVIKARLLGTKPSGGKIEALVERVVAPRRAMAMLRASHAPKAGQTLHFDGSVEATVVGRRGEFFLLEFEQSVLDVLERCGELPLPPYIERQPDSEDEARYQTIYARVSGAVAAPTAGLHFDQAMLRRLESMGAKSAFVTLHVGAGTFQPVRVDDLDRHVMHSEYYRIPDATVEAVGEARRRGGRVLSVGTTGLRALESAAQTGSLIAGDGETTLFVRPGYRFRVVDRLLTNFHLPRSTLLMLVSAFAGTENICRAYRHAVQMRYRFFSYGDAMLIERGRQE
jgi:S-adenosylmethionine:tRNA ribosyltransferase-isomerase